MPLVPIDGKKRARHASPGAHPHGEGSPSSKRLKETLTDKDQKDLEPMDAGHRANTADEGDSGHAGIGSNLNEEVPDAEDLRKRFAIRAAAILNEEVPDIEDLRKSFEIRHISNSILYGARKSGDGDLRAEVDQVNSLVGHPRPRP